jgi:5'-3' exonuclease
MDGDIRPAIDENEIFVDICRYIDHLFQLVKPRQYCYISIDGT